MKEPTRIAANLYDSNGERLRYRELFVIDESNNGVMRYQETTAKKVYDKPNRNSMIAILNNGKIGILTYKEFEDGQMNNPISKPTLEIMANKDVSIDYLKQKMGLTN